uniref:uncharacterized protein n=1 Tax=Semicossyphus pulcher TaxID=241346 RepID=UPI0037E9C91E
MEAKGTPTSLRMPPSRTTVDPRDLLDIAQDFDPADGVDVYLDHDADGLPDFRIVDPFQPQFFAMYEYHVEEDEDDYLFDDDIQHLFDLNINWEEDTDSEDIGGWSDDSGYVAEEEYEENGYDDDIRPGSPPQQFPPVSAGPPAGPGPEEPAPSSSGLGSSAKRRREESSASQLGVGGCTRQRTGPDAPPPPTLSTTLFSQQPMTGQDLTLHPPTLSTTLLASSQAMGNAPARPPQRMLFLISFFCAGRLSASSTPPSLPAPKLDIYLRSKDSVTLVCRAPEGHRAVHYLLYRHREQVDSQELPSGAEEVQFTVRLQEAVSGQSELFCCLYKDPDGRFSAFSPYLQLEHQQDADPTRPIPSYPPPILSVTPSAGVVNRGDVLSFSCSVPALSQSASKNKPMTFFLLRAAEGTGTSIIQQPQASRVPNTEPQPGLFTVGPVRGGEEGEYTCLYQITKKRGLVNSTVSNAVHITIKDPLPVPTLDLQQQTDVWHLLCRGSAAYPGAVFSLYLADSESPVDTQHATLFEHQVTFPVPVQDTPLASYQCQYSVLLGGAWSHSEHSLPFAVTRGPFPPPSSPDALAVDWPLVLGSFSAVVLFLCSLALVVVVALRKVKAAAEEKKKRQEAQFWTQVHAKDHVVDLTLRRTSLTSQGWASADATRETGSRSPLWSSMSTFTTPTHQIH